MRLECKEVGVLETIQRLKRNPTIAPQKKRPWDVLNIQCDDVLDSIECVIPLRINSHQVNTALFPKGETCRTTQAIFAHAHSHGKRCVPPEKQDQSRNIPGGQSSDASSIWRGHQHGHAGDRTLDPELIRLMLYHLSYASNCTHCGDRTHDHPLKRRTLYRLS